MQSNEELPSVFLGSSLEARKVAETVAKKLENLCEMKPWWTVFQPNDTSFETLFKQLSEVDFAIFILTPDDTVEARGKSVCIPRDNVLFEFGLFLGLLGRNRVFAIIEKSVKLPTDLQGVTLFYIQGGKRRELDEACSNIKRLIMERGKKEWPSHLLSHLEKLNSKKKDIKDRHFRVVGSRIMWEVSTAISQLAEAGQHEQNEAAYLKSLINVVSGLKRGDELLAICGDKNWKLREVYEYLNENIALAKEGVRVHRLYLAPEVGDPFEWGVILSHLKWAAQLKNSFKVEVLPDNCACDVLGDIKLSPGFGMVITKQRGARTVRIHSGLPDGKQGGWELQQDYIVAEYEKIFEEVSRKANITDVLEKTRKKLEEVENDSRRVAYHPLLWRVETPERPI